MLATALVYSVVLLRRGHWYAGPHAPGIIWEHGRRNFALRADGVLALVCPVADDSDLAARLMDGDPAVRARVLNYEVHPVRGFPGDGLPAVPDR